jgi:YfiH family protein
MGYERRSVGRGGHVLVDTALESDGFLAAFSERTGGASDAPYDSLNLAFHVGDDPEPVRQNRHALVEQLGLPPFAAMEQVHASKVAKVGAKRGAAGFDDPAGALPGTDAMATRSAGVSLAVLTADCVPLVAGSPAEGMLVVGHVGWRGLAAGIVGAVARQFPEPRDVRVSLGPCVGPCHYEVGEDVAFAVASGTGAGAVTERRGGSLFLDLAKTVRADLRALGIGRVEDTGLCTACEAKRFFSYRRDEVTGRQAAVAIRL